MMFSSSLNALKSFLKVNTCTNTANGMFVLREIKDTIKIEPKDFGRPTEAALADEVNRRYSNKVGSIVIRSNVTHS